MRAVIWSTIVMLFSASSAFAAEPADAKTLLAWKNYEKAQAEYRAAIKEPLAAVRAAKNAKDRAKALSAYRKASTKGRVGLTKASDAFRDAFAKSDWQAWDAEKQAKLLEFGLGQVARHATTQSKFDVAIKANSTLLARLPKSRGASRARLNIGDLYAVQGKVSEARDQYEEAVEAGDARTKVYAKQRLTLYAKPAPDIASKQWIGGEATSLSELKGKVVVIDFWATWCGPCRVVMPGLSELYAKHKNDGLVVIGLTRYYKNGYLPANPKQMLSGGKGVRDMSEKQFLDHVTAFKKNTKMSYPFVIGQPANFKDYLVSGIPSVAVIDTTGKVALLAVGSGSEPLVRAVVKRELKKISK